MNAIETENTTSDLYEEFLERNQHLKEFWNRWQSEYLPLLNATFRKSKDKKQIGEGDIVLLELEGKRRHLWPLGRIENVYKGIDGKIRTASVMCKKKILRRPINKLYCLEQSVCRGGLIDEGNRDVSLRKCDREIVPPVKYGW